MLNLAILLSDSIDKKKLRDHMAAKPSKFKQIDAELAAKCEKVGSIDVLEAFLVGEGLDTTIIDCLRMIQGVRSASVAHRKSKDYAKRLKSYDVGQADRPEYVRKLLLELIELFDRL